MQKFLRFLVLFAAIAVFSGTASAATKKPKLAPKLAKICKKIIPLSDVLYKFETSGGIGTHDVRDGSCTLVAGAGQEGQYPGLNFMSIYSSKGNPIGQFSLYQNCPRCAFSWRYYTCSASHGISHFCSDVVQKAQKDAHNKEGYIGLKNGKCYFVPDLGSRAGNAVP